MPPSDGGGFATTVREPTTIVSLSTSGERDQARDLAVETAVNVVYGGIPFAVMMATPADLDDFALGFSLTEGVIDRIGQLRQVRIEEDELGLKLHVDIAADRLRDHMARRRALSGRTGCGVCGIDDLNALRRVRPEPLGQAGPIPTAAIKAALDDLSGHQILNRTTGAVHAAGFADPGGTLRLVREDVGRHNALDKLIGAALREGVDARAGFVVITSRCSFEMIEKAGAFGAHTLVAISAPTSLAVERARALDITLIGVARNDSMTIFHDARRFPARGCA